MELKQAMVLDLKNAVNLIEEAKNYLKSAGINQWQSDYPNRDTISKDIMAHNAYVLIDKGQMAGYVCISFDGEKCYQKIQGKWKSEQSYAVIHRLAISNAFKGKGLSSIILKYAEELCLSQSIHSIKIDTDEQNLTMQHLLTKNGYSYCGIIQFENSDKVAFERVF